MSTALHRLSIAALSAGLHDGRFAARALTEALLDRAEALNPSLHAFVEIWRQEALDRADALDHAGPQPDQTLWGIPLAHKDMFARPGRQPGCGVAGPVGGADLPPSPSLEAFAAAGVIDLGPLVLAEFALGITGTNAHHGNAANPWDLSRCSGASSSGSGVAVAAGLAAGSLGTDTGASVRVPASFCGVVGLKPTAWAIDGTGIFPSSWSMDCAGVLARTVADTALLFAAARGMPRPVRPDGDGGLRIGVPHCYYTDHADPDVAAAWEAACAAMERAGHRLVRTSVVERAEIRALARLVMRTEAAAVHRDLMPRHPANYPTSVRKFISGGEGLLAVDYVDALRLRAALLREALAITYSQVDALLTPTVPMTPPRYDEIADATDARSWRRVALMAQYTQPASYLGLPALSVPFTLSAGGLPIGMQLIGAPGAEDTLFRAAAPLERHWRGLDPWPRDTP